jgi:phospholipid/cholesterol/gamma-HCH transport system substrate-binding protein
MAQHKQLTWTELRVGLFVLAALFILAIAIIWVTGAGTLGPKYRLYTYLPEVEDVQTGAPVRLDGVEVGNVEKIELNPQPSDRTHNIKMSMRISRKYQSNIRSDSEVRLVTEGLLGNRYVSISRGIGGAPIADNGTVKGTEEKAIKAIVERGVELEENLVALSQQVGNIVNRVNEGQGTIGKLLSHQELYNRMNSAVAGIQTMVASTQKGEGTLGKLVVSDELYDKANATMGHAETLLADVRAQKGTLGKLIYDPDVYQDSKKFLERGNAVLGDIQEGKGTLGKLATDEALYTNLRDASANIKDATAKLNGGEGTMGKFFADPEFYDNLTGLSADLRALINQFRQNPKKFLRVKFAIF